LFTFPDAVRINLFILGKAFQIHNMGACTGPWHKVDRRLGILLINSKEPGSDMFTAVWNPFHATSATTIKTKCLFLAHWY